MMSDIRLQLPIFVPAARVFGAMTQPDGLSAWWTLAARGVPALGETYDFDFGPSYQWTGRVSHCEHDVAFEWTMGTEDPDWAGTRVGFTLEPIESGTRVEFYHRGWPEANAHFRGSSYCWATYLRLLKRYLEHGEFVPYAQRDSA